jgi:hypothetical protein
MTIKAYLLAALTIFVAVITSSDLIARITIAGLTLAEAAREHLQWLSLTVLGVILLFAPFGGIALICGTANKRARTRSAATLFFLSTAVLAYFYFQGFQASQEAMLAQRWTAAALSIGLLPFYVGLPLAAVVAVLAGVIARLDRRLVTQA